MNLKLDHTDLVNLVKGSTPNYQLHPGFELNGYGRYSDNYGWQWETSRLQILPDTQLYDIYLKSKQSWK